MIPNPDDRKLTLKELFYASWKIYCRRFGIIFGVLFCWQVLLIGVDSTFTGNLFGELNHHWFVWEFRASSLFGFLGMLFVIFLTAQSVRTEQVQLKKVFQCVGNICLSAFVIRLMFLAGGIISSGLVKFLAFVECPEIGVLIFRFAVLVIETVLGVYFIFVYQALILKQKRAFSVFICSFQVVRGSWWKLFGIQLLFKAPVGLPLTILMVVAVGREMAVEWFGSPWMLYLFHPLMAVLYAFFTVFYTLYFLNVVQHDRACLAE
ncbi:hypothetical protein [Tichowtungia aerotolerans]|uniref:Uncharacterized protein n=1 Tax=Tichowtungia aerotolerans TaxID=2697043 RepID=A0A6P1LZX9_9BACT|nr:hypothetical protein [Tichowtungia aerotolerans]QHI68099.1 hypothetical protein GT409_01070 [Tichowtungia aerotolerans]